jgi:hypothetical protein
LDCEGLRSYAKYVAGCAPSAATASSQKSTSRGGQSLKATNPAEPGRFRRFATEPGLIGLDWAGFRDAQAPARRFVRRLGGEVLGNRDAL